jgi:hypothetical protein
MIDMNLNSSMDWHIDNLRASKGDRRIAKEHMRTADFVADLVCHVADALRFAEGFLGKLLAHRAG